VTLSVPDRGEPYLRLADDAGKTRATLGAAELERTHTGVIEKRPTSSLVLLDKEGKVIWKAP
jgi:hypothetical protein